MKIPHTVRIAALVLVTTGFYGYVGQMVPQKEVQPPQEIAVASDLTTADMVTVGRQIMEGKGLCVTCHTLGADQANRAGPTLAGIFGRRIATAPGYNFSEALKRLDIVWTPETVSRLFEIGPAAYTPGTKMPEQRIGSEQDRAALVQFLVRATKR